MTGRRIRLFLAFALTSLLATAAHGQTPGERRVGAGAPLSELTRAQLGALTCSTSVNPGAQWYVSDASNSGDDCVSDAGGGAICFCDPSAGTWKPVGSPVAGSGDITDVWTGTSGNVNALTAAAGDTLDASAADSTKPHKTGTALPGTCSVGQTFFDTDAPAGQNTYACTATNTWTLQGDGSGGGSGDITDVWSANTGDVSALTAAGGDTLDARNADSTYPHKSGTAPPGTCTVGMTFFDTDATAGQNTLACTATNTWTVQGDGGGGGTDVSDAAGIAGTSIIDDAVAQTLRGILGGTAMACSLSGDDVSCSLENESSDLNTWTWGNDAIFGTWSFDSDGDGDPTLQWADGLLQLSTNAAIPGNGQMGLVAGNFNIGNPNHTDVEINLAELGSDCQIIADHPTIDFVGCDLEIGNSSVVTAAEVSALTLDGDQITTGVSVTGGIGAEDTLVRRDGSGNVDLANGVNLPATTYASLDAALQAIIDGKLEMVGTVDQDPNGFSACPVASAGFRTIVRTDTPTDRLYLCVVGDNSPANTVWKDLTTPGCGPSILPPHYFGTPPTASSASGSAWTSAGELRCVDYVQPCTADGIDTLKFEIAAAASGEVASVGIYTGDGGTKLVDSGAISTTGTGIKSYTLPAAVTFDAGVEYRICFATSAAATAAFRSYGAAMNMSASQLLGDWTEAGTAANDFEHDLGCAALDDPWDCCTGAGTGTCANAMPATTGALTDFSSPTNVGTTLLTE